jgi:hypothetical protein
MRSKILYYFKKVRTPFFLLSAILSVVGSYQLYGGNYTNIFKEFTVILISVMKLFTFAPTNGLLNEAPLAYELAIWMAPLSTMVGIFSIFDKLYKTISLGLYHVNKEHIVIMGADEDAINFIKNLQRDMPRVRIYSLLDEGEKFDEKRLEELSVEVIRLDYSNPQDEINLLKIKDKKIGDKGIIISFESEPKSYGRVSALNPMYSNNNKEINLYIKTEDYRIKELVELKMDELDSFDIHYFTIEELLIKDLLENSDFIFSSPRSLKNGFEKEKYGTMEEIAREMGTYNLLIIGFSKISEQFLNQASNLLTINPIENLKVTIIDQNATKKFNKYKDYKTMIDKVLDYTLIDLDSEREIGKVVKELHEKNAFSGVLFGAEDIYDNILKIDRVIDNITDLPVAVYSKEFEIIETLVESLFLRHDNITVFGDSKDVLTMDIIVNESLMENAKHFNAYYNMISSEMMGWEDEKISPEEQWKKLSNIKKESSIYQSAHQDTKINILEKFINLEGLPNSVNEIIDLWNEKIENKNISEQLSIIESNPYMNYMTALEHKRWNNFYYMRDFVFDEVKDEKRKTHDCLIDDWDEFLGGIQRDKAIYDFISTLSLR